jgi:PAS domain S-box-containing protein
MEGARIVIVEDESIVARDLQHTLQRLGYRVAAIASSGEEAIRVVTKLRPDLVLMDIVLKGAIDGVEAGEQIRRQMDIPLVFLTAYSDDATMQRAKVTEPFGYVLKPFEERELHSNIQMALYRHEIERRLRESEERYRSLFDRVLVGLYRTLPDGQILDVNPALVQMLRYPDRATLLATNVEDGYIDPKDHHRWLDLIERHQHIVGFEVCWRCYDGRPIWVSDSARAIRDGQGSIVYYEGSVEDITARKRVEQEREALIGELQQALVQVKTLRGLLPICASCKKIRDDQGYWHQVEAYVEQHSEAEFSHGLCPACAEQLYPEFTRDDREE